MAKIGIRCLFSLAIACLLLGSTLAPAGAGVTAKVPPPLPSGPAVLTAAGPPAGNGPWVVRAYYRDRRMVDELAAWLEPWEVRHDEGYVVVAVTAAGYTRLLEAGFRLEVDAQLTGEWTRPRAALDGQVSGIPGYPCYRTVEETYAAAQALAATHPALATWSDVGDSWDKVQPGGNGGYDLLVLRLTNSAVSGPKPKLFAMAAIHAREYATAELATRLGEYLVDSYGVDPDVTWLLDYHEIHLMLEANPDGRHIAETANLMWRKNTDNDDGCSSSTSWGTDLNRNFEFQWGAWGGSSGDPCAEVYRGPAAASEPETMAVQDYLRAQFPDQRAGPLDAPAPETATGVFVDLHSYGELVLWPWGFTGDLAPNGTALQTLGRKLAYYNGYTPAQAINLYRTDGTTDDFAYGDLGLASYAFELGPQTTFFPDCATFENGILPDNVAALTYAAKVARAPYLMPAGPDALSLAASPSRVVAGEPIHLAATIDDGRYQNIAGVEPTQDIAAAEFYLDVPPWVTTTAPVGWPLTAVDGTFDEKAEAVDATVDTEGLAPGRHILFVRGRDASGNWGVTSALFVYVVHKAYLPVVNKP